MSILRTVKSFGVYQTRLMSTFSLPEWTPNVQVRLVEGLQKEELLAFPAFKTWLSTLRYSLTTQQNEHHTFHEKPYQLRKVEVQSIDRFGGGRLGFVKLKADVTNDAHESLPGSVFLRGGSVGMLVRICMMRHGPTDP